MPEWIDLVQLSELPEGQPVTVNVEDHELVVCKVDDTCYAVSNTCPHAGLPLSDGELSGCVLTCPYHGYAYNVKDGKNVDFPEEEIPVPTYPIKVDNNRVFVQIP